MKTFFIKYKVYLIGVAAVLLYIGGLKADAAWQKFKLKLEKIDRIESLETRMDTLEVRTTKELNKITETVKSSRTRSRATNKKRIDDEKTIDSKPIDDDKRKKFVSRFEN